MMDVSKWPATSIELAPIESLLPYARNSRTHDDAHVDQIVASMREWGWTIPILIDETGMILAGHGRVLAARKLGISHVPVMTARGWSEAQKRAYVIADNKLSENAGWDAKLLAVEFDELKGLNFDTGLLGFSSDPIADDAAEKAKAKSKDQAEDTLAVDSRKIAMTQAERDSFQKLLDRYAEEFGVHYGFVAWLLEPRAM